MEFLFVFLLFTSLWLYSFSKDVKSIDCDIVIVGGSLSSLAAGLSSIGKKSLSEIQNNDIKVCLTEPTNWLGGQITSSAVSAIDFCWHTLTDKETGEVYRVYEVCRKKENLPPLFYEIIENRIKDHGKCWVSTHCFQPQYFLNEIEKILGIKKDKMNRIVEINNLKIFYNTVLKKANVNGNRIESVEVIQRTPKESTKDGGYDIFLSKDIERYYDTNEDERYFKTVYNLKGKIFIETSEFGELLALAAPDDYLQGIAEQYDGDVSRKGEQHGDICGQDITYGFAQEIFENEVEEPKNPYPVLHPSFYSLNNFTWDQVWTYRRLQTEGKSTFTNDITLQNWGFGNDYVFNYLFKSFEETKKEATSGNWTGGIKLNVLEDAEYLAYGYHYFFKNIAPSQYKNKMKMKKEVFGTSHGLSKIPYLRDTRRSIGINDFVMTIDDISGSFKKSKTGKKFFDRIGICVYTVDIHHLENCKYQEYMKKKYEILPYYLPFRAFTNRKINNLLCAGKNIASSFLVSSSIRTHPGEFSSGTSSGVVARFMVEKKIMNTKEIIEKTELLEDLQKTIKNFNPIDWELY